MKTSSKCSNWILRKCSQDPDSPDYEKIEVVPVVEPNVITTVDEMIDDGEEQNSLINEDDLKPQEPKKQLTRNRISNIVTNTRKSADENK